jgi:hypothetical protein
VPGAREAHNADDCNKNQIPVHISLLFHEIIKSVLFIQYGS